MKARYYRCHLIGLGLLLLTLASCSSQSMTLVHPQTGSTIRCGAVGGGIMASAVDSMMADCRSYERQGYVRVEELTPEQRLDLERRGLLPKPDPPATRMSY
ncbi:MAG: hypothetical protein HY695_21590 [Deltaproteobacteria bacterium]|nr:hypothetical protein [Deltaproteobacteria bacterium]